MIKAKSVHINEKFYHWKIECGDNFLLFGYLRTGIQPQNIGSDWVLFWSILATFSTSHSQNSGSFIFYLCFRVAINTTVLCKVGLPVLNWSYG